jgi:thiamine transport system permease protein
VLGIVTVFGRNGWLNHLADTVGAGRPLDIYGLTGILIAHVFFNGPLATRMLLARLDAVPAETWRLAAQLSMGGSAEFRHIEWPAIRSVLPGIGAIVFMLCVTSFTIVLTLGGGPAATTLEVAIYQSLRFDFDPGRAVLLALLQVLLSGALVIAALRLAAPMAAMPGRMLAGVRPAATGHGIADALVIAAACTFVALPLLAIARAGAAAPFAVIFAQPMFWQATMTSLAVAAASACLCLGMAGALVAAARAARRRRGAGTVRMARIYSSAASLILLMPPLVLGAGWFMLLHRLGAAFALAPAMVIAINALMALPYAVRILDGAVEAGAREHDRLCESLALSGWTRFRLIDWPMLKAPIALAMALAAALSLGDLGVAALFGSERFVTLPLLLYQRMGSYRIDDAAGIALLLALLCLALFYAGERATERGGP